MRSSWILLFGLGVGACNWFADECEPIEEWCDSDIKKTCHSPDDIRHKDCTVYGAKCIEEGSIVYCGYPEIECEPYIERDHNYCFDNYLASCPVYESYKHPKLVRDCQERSEVSCIQEPGYLDEYREGAYCGFPARDCPVEDQGNVCVGNVVAECKHNEHPLFVRQCGTADYDTYCVEDGPQYGRLVAKCAFHPDNCEFGDLACSPDFDFLWLRCELGAFTEAFRCAPDLVCVEQELYGVSCE